MRCAATDGGCRAAFHHWPACHLQPINCPSCPSFACPAAKKVLIVPGYGLAVANAQYAVADLVTGLRKKGIEVK